MTITAADVTNSASNVCAPSATPMSSASFTSPSPRPPGECRYEEDSSGAGPDREVLDELVRFRHGDDHRDHYRRRQDDHVGEQPVADVDRSQQHEDGAEHHTDEPIARESVHDEARGGERGADDRDRGGDRSAREQLGEAGFGLRGLGLCVRLIRHLDLAATLRAGLDGGRRPRARAHWTFGRAGPSRRGSTAGASGRTV